MGVLLPPSFLRESGWAWAALELQLCHINCLETRFAERGMSSLPQIRNQKNRLKKPAFT